MNKTPASRIIALAFAVGFLPAVRAASVTYDADTVTPGAQDGAGLGWNTTSYDFWDGAQNITWPNTTADEAIFGAASGAAGTVTVGTVTANKITFSAPGSGNYTLSAGTITLGGTTPTISANTDGAIGSVMAGSAGLVKDGGGKLTLTGANSYSGGTTVSAGTLQIGNASTNGTFGTGTYSVAAGTTLYLNYATAVQALTSGWASKVTGAGTIEVNSAQAVNGSANWGPNSSTATPLVAGFTGTLVLDKGRFDSSPTGFGGTSKLVIKSGAQFLAWGGTTSGTALVYSLPLDIAGTGWGESGYPGGLRLAGGTQYATWSGAVTLTADSVIMAQAGGNLTITGSITGNYLCEFYTQTSNGNIYLTPAAAVQNSYGSTKINGSGSLGNSVVAGNQYAFSTGPLTVAASYMKLNGNNFTFASLTGTGGQIWNGHASTAAVITVGTDNTSTTSSTVMVNGSTGTLGLTKTGTGTLTLTGANTYTGPTSVNSGALILNPSSGGLSTSSAVSVAAGATFGGKGTSGAITAATGSTIQGGINNAGSLSATSLTFAGDATLNVMPVTGTTASVAVSGAVTTNGTQTINVVNTAPLAGGSYRLVSYGSISGSGIGAFILGTTPSDGGSRPRSYALDTTTAPASYVGLTVTVDSAVWSGGTDGNWDTTTTGNWVKSSDSSPTVYFLNDLVVFNDSSAVRTILLNNENVSPGSVTFNNSAGNDFSLSGSKSITGTTTLTKSGTGSLIITNTNTYTGGTTISGGTLQLGDGTTNGVIAGAITNNANLVFANGSAQSYTGVISGTGTVTKSAAGVLTVGTSNTYSGTTIINGGVLAGTSFIINGSTSSLGNGTAITLNGGTLRYTGANYGSDAGNKFNRNIFVDAGGGTMDVGGTGILWYNGTITGTGTLTFLGSAGTSKQWLVTSNSPGFSGNVVIGNGTAGSGFPQIRSNATNPLGTGTITVNTGGVLSCDNGSTVPTGIANNIVLSGGFLGTQIPTVTYSGSVTASTGTTSTVGTYTTGNTGDVTLSGALLGDGILSTTSPAVASRSVRLSGNNSGFVGTWRSTSSMTYFNSATSGSAGAKWVANGAPFVGNITGGGTVDLGELSGTTGVIRNDVTGTTFVVSVGALNTNSTFGGGITDKSGDSTSKTGLTKVGTGTLTLTGTTTSYTYTGPTNVNAGTLAVPPNAAATTAVSVADAAALTIGGAAGTTYNATALTLGSASGATISINNFGSSPTVAPVNVTGALNASGIVTVNVNGIFAAGTFPLMKYGSLGGDGFPAFVLGTLPRGASASLVDTGTEIDLVIGGFNPLTWDGSSGSIWDINTTSNWTLGGSPDIYLEGDKVLFDDQGSGTVVLNTTVNPGQVDFATSTKDYTLSGTGHIAGTTGLTKSGPMSLTILNDNTYTGATTVNAGTLVIGDGSTDGSISGALVNNANTAFRTSGSRSYVGTITNNAAGNLTLDTTGSLTLGGSLTNNGTITVQSTGTSTLSGALSGTGATIDKNGSGTMIMTGASNTFAGAINVNEGTLQIGNAGTNGNFGSSTYNIAAGAKLYLNYLTAVPGGAGTWSSKISGAGTLELNSAQAVAALANWGPNLAAGVSFGSGFTGTLVLDRGRFDSAPSGMGGVSNIVIKNGSTFLTWTGTFTQPISIAGQGWGEAGWPGTLRAAASAITTWAGDVTLTADSNMTSQDSNSLLTITGAITGPFECMFIRNGPIVIAPAIPVQNSYGSTRVVSSGGTSLVSAGNQYAFSTGPLLMGGGALGYTGGSLALNGFDFTFASLSGTSGTIGNYHASNNCVITVGTDNSSTSYSGALTDGSTGKLGLTKTGTGTLTLTGSLSYSGNTTVNQGTLSISTASLNDNSTVTLAAGTVLDLTSGVTDTIAILVIDGVTVPSGTYNSSHPTYGTYFTGTGSLNVAGPYGPWAAAAGLTGANNGKAQDPDGDGIPNLMEFYLDGNPLAANTAILPAETLDATYLTLTFSRRDDAEADVTSQLVRYGPNLATLGSAGFAVVGTTSGTDLNGVIVTITENDSAPDTIVVRIPRTLAAGDRFFARLEVTK